MTRTLSERKTRAAAILVAPLLMLAAVLPAQAKQQVNIGLNVSWPGFSMLKVAKEKGLAEDYDLNITIFEDPLGGHAALAAGQIDVYLSTAEYTPFTIARDTDVALVSLLNISYGVDKVVMTEEMTPEQLKGQKVAAPQAYIGEILMGMWLDSIGLVPDDVNWVNLNADEAVGPAMSGDLAAAYMYEPWVTRVLDNLVGNSIKFTEAAGTITVSVRRDNARAVVSVRDTGAGIRPELLESIFGLFQQETQDVARGTGGLGIGLSLAKGLVELHQGSIEAHSAGLGKGAELVIRLPLTSAPEEQTSDKPGEGAAPMRILIVEDNADAAQMLRDLLEISGHEVVIATRGQEALEVLRQKSVDAVLCDLGLPGMSGYEVARAVREDSALHHLPLIALSGYGQAEDRQRTADAGFDDHLTKPANLEAVNTALRRARKGS